MKYLLALSLLAISPVLAQTVTTYTFPPQACVYINSCMILDHAEDSLAIQDRVFAGQLVKWVQLSPAGAANGYYCPDETITDTQTGTEHDSILDCDSATNSGQDFAIHAEYHWHPYTAGGRYGGTRYQVEAATATLTLY